MGRSSPRAEDVIAHVDRCSGAGCTGCDVRLLGHDAVVGLLLGFLDEPLCLTCLARRHGRERGSFLESAYHRVRRLACYRAGWRYADEQLTAAGPWPEDRLPARFRMPAEEDASLPEEPGHERAFGAGASSAAGRLESAVADYPRRAPRDAGDRGCGELALELRLRVRRLDPGARLLLRTTDAGAPEDLPAWCRLTGNFLVAAEPPRYLIETGPRTSTLSDS